jgi:cytochrome bd-I ubiquinol oxidase subunit X
MWYFTWILGVGFACTFAVLNAMWLEMQQERRTRPVPVRANTNEDHARS